MLHSGVTVDHFRHSFSGGFPGSCRVTAWSLRRRQRRRCVTSCPCRECLEHRLPTNIPLRACSLRRRRRRRSLTSSPCHVTPSAPLPAAAAACATSRRRRPPLACAPTRILHRTIMAKCEIVGGHSIYRQQQRLAGRPGGTVHDQRVPGHESCGRNKHKQSSMMLPVHFLCLVAAAACAASRRRRLQPAYARTQILHNRCSTSHIICLQHRLMAALTLLHIQAAPSIASACTDTNPARSESRKIHRDNIANQPLCLQRHALEVCDAFARLCRFSMLFDLERCTCHMQGQGR